MAAENEAEPKYQCRACQGRGWLLSFNVDRDVYEIQRCDTCGKYDSDRQAGDRAAPMIEAALAVMVELILGSVKATREEGRR